MRTMTYIPVSQVQTLLAVLISGADAVEPLPFSFDANRPDDEPLRSSHFFYHQGIGVFGAEYLAGRLMGLDPLQTVIPWTLGEGESLRRRRSWSRWCISFLC